MNSRCLLVAALTAAGCAGGGGGSYGGQAPAEPGTAHVSPAPTLAMPAAAALGLWQTSFGPVKIVANGAAGPQAIMGVWVYDRDGREVIGFFGGQLSGNVLSFSWHEPAGAPGLDDDLTGSGYLTFNPAERRFFGRWWSGDGRLDGSFSGVRPRPANVAEAAQAPDSAMLPVPDPAAASGAQQPPPSAPETPPTGDDSGPPGPPPPRPANALGPR
ncbi:MAG TPA: hypothetical protein VFG83_14470 [Kofleriaceae bacterium]|nr:hypothetical protein [Kofleriaceae bacterium]